MLHIVILYYRRVEVYIIHSHIILQESAGFVYGSMSFTDKLANGAAVTIIQYMNPCM
jgi:hypothetical protein